jgi:hypothetical protein
MLSKDNVIVNWYNKVESTDKFIDRALFCESIYELMKKYDIIKPYVVSKDILDENSEVLSLFNAIKTQYPMMEHINIHTVNKTVLIDYINMVDKNNT